MNEEEISKIIIEVLGHEDSYTEEEMRENMDDIHNDRGIPDSDLDALFEEWDKEDEEAIRKKTLEEKEKIKTKINIEDDSIDKKTKRL